MYAFLKKVVDDVGAVWGGCKGRVCCRVYMGVGVGGYKEEESRG